LPNWEHCRVGILGEDGIFLATDGWPSRPRLLISRGALQQLGEHELEAVFLHEHAHWRGVRWHVTLLLFLLRLVQLHNPVALWAFREYSMETEIDCDAAAVSGRNSKHLARALLKVYESTDVRDISVRSRLRKRVDILLGRTKRVDDDLPLGSVLLAALALLLLLPWIV
jgi:beta-lactamase regulating signal transducer with metallopeptidase domain